MNTSNRHPDTELLDRLRSGLLDDAPQQKSRLQAHLADCEICRKRAGWPASPDRTESEHLQNRLDQARQRALRVPRRTSPARFVIPVASAAAVALLAVVLIKPLPQSSAPESRLAEAQAREVPELYEELDFYLWLADHKANIRDSAT